MDMFTIFLFRPWASFDCAKVVVRYVDEIEISFNILEVRVWGCKHVFMFHYLSYRSIEGFQLCTWHLFRDSLV
jgi:hypothetical protein